MRSDGPHKPRTGAGYVKRKDGDYARAKGNGCEPLACCAHLSRASVASRRSSWGYSSARQSSQRMNRLTHYEYDQTTWAARSWSTFSVAVHLAMATELAVALGLPVVGDPRAA